MKLRYILILLALLVGGTALLVRNQTPVPDNRLAVTATYYPLYNLAQNVGGDKVSVVNVTPAGSEPHDYEPTPRQIVQADRSKLFVYNGGTMEPWVGNFLKDYQHTTVKASSGIKLNDGVNEETGQPAAGTQDPHFWLDPVLAQQIVDNIRDGLIKADPSQTTYYQQQAAAYNKQLAQLDQDYAQGLKNCQSRTIVTSHAAFSYLAKRYNLEVVPIAGISPDAEPSAAKLAELTNLVRQKNIKFIFFESLASPKLAKTIARETGAQTAVFDPIEGLSTYDQQQGKNYLSVQRANLAALRSALTCQ